MKLLKPLIASLLSASMLISFSSCCLSHEFDEATCTEPATCSKCGETEGEALGHKFKSATCTKPKTCLRCNETEGEARGHEYENNACIRCSKEAPIPSLHRSTVFSSGAPDTLRFEMNTAGGISFKWKHDYIDDKKIDYINITYTLYDAVGNPTPDDIYHKSTHTMRLIGPFSANSTINFTSDVFIYCDVCDKISFDEILFEYSDGSKAKVDYGWKNSVH